MATKNDPNSFYFVMIQTLNVVKEFGFKIFNFTKHSLDITRGDKDSESLPPLLQKNYGRNYFLTAVS
jgi:hypothetical protein